MTANTLALAGRRRLLTVLLGLGLVLGLVLGLALQAARAAEVGLPPPVGPVTPLAKPLLGDDGLYHQSWFELSFLDLAEEFAKAKAAGKRFVVLFEQRGCPYCARLHTEVLARRYINDYVRENFAILQLNLWGSREVTDFDGAKLPEKDLAARWGVIFTPTIIFYKDDLSGLEGKWGRELEAVERLPLSYGHDTFYDLLVWLRHKIYAHDGNFQRFHIARIAEREALTTATEAASNTENKRGNPSGIGAGDH
jgi:thioredoxin-related protein